MFAYCVNNAIAHIDVSGNKWNTNTLINKSWQFVNSLLNTAGFAWDSRQKIFYSVNDCWQRSFGYCDLYDTLSPLAGIYIIHFKVPFKYNGKEWMIWMWRGRYGITIGAEIGVYIYSTKYSFKYNGITFHSMKWYRAAHNNERLAMSFTLYLNGKKLFSRSSKKSWWLTGFKPNIHNIDLWNLNLKNNLKMVGSITFFSTSMAKAFCKSAHIKFLGSKTVKFTWR